MFFVGVLLVVQASWSCLCNREIKKQVWIGCNSDFETVLEAKYKKKKNNLFFRFSQTYNALQLQLFRLCFLEVLKPPITAIFSAPPTRL